MLRGLLRRKRKMPLLSQKHFELLKGIAIIAVLICHTGGYSGVTWFTPLGGIGVALFLFCSGYGLTCSYTKTDLKNFWKKKILSVYATYFFIEIIAAIVLSRSFKSIILDLLLIRPAYIHGWYMQYLFGCYFIFWAAFKFIRQERARLCILLTLSVISFFAFDGLRGEQAFTFVGGILTAEIVKKKELSLYKYYTVIAILLLVLSVALLATKQLPVIRQQNMYMLTFLDLLIKTFVAASIIYLTYAIKLIYKIGYAFFCFWGRISYSLYLVHGYLIFIMTNTIFGNYLIRSVIYSILSVATAYLVNILAKRLPRTLYKTFKIK